VGVSGSRLGVAKNTRSVWQHGESQIQRGAKTERKDGRLLLEMQDDAVVGRRGEAVERSGEEKNNSAVKESVVWCVWCWFVRRKETERRPGATEISRGSNVFRNQERKSGDVYFSDPRGWGDPREKEKIPAVLCVKTREIRNASVEDDSSLGFSQGGLLERVVGKRKQSPENFWGSCFLRASEEGVWAENSVCASASAASCVLLGWGWLGLAPFLAGLGCPWAAATARTKKRRPRAMATKKTSLEPRGGRHNTVLPTQPVGSARGFAAGASPLRRLLLADPLATPTGVGTRRAMTRT